VGVVFELGKWLEELEGAECELDDELENPLFELDDVLEELLSELDDELDEVALFEFDDEFEEKGSELEEEECELRLFELDEAECELDDRNENPLVFEVLDWFELLFKLDDLEVVEAGVVFELGKWLEEELFRTLLGKVGALFGELLWALLAALFIIILGRLLGTLFVDFDDPFVLVLSEEVVKLDGRAELEFCGEVGWFCCLSL
jgi:hypothetical protein